MIYKKIPYFHEPTPGAPEAFVVKIRGKSNETKPTKLNGNNISIGSRFFEVDTFKCYEYDGANWHLIDLD